MRSSGVRRVVVLALVGAALAHPALGRGAKGSTAPTGPARTAGACRVLASEEDRVAAVRDGGEVALASGRAVRVVDVRLDAQGGGHAWLASLAGTAVRVEIVGGPDRWGRVPAALRTADGTPVDLAELMVGEGFAAVDAGERDALCEPDLLRVEAAARARRIGLWAADPVVPAAGRDALAGRAGRFTVVEGRVVSVGERRERTYLNFGPDWSRDFSAVIGRRTWAALKARGIAADGLRGRTVRVRGIVEAGGRAPQVELVAPDMLEVGAAEDRGR